MYDKFYVIARLEEEIKIAQSRQKQNAPRKSGYIRGLEKSIEIIKSTM